MDPPWKLFVYNEAFKRGGHLQDKAKHVEGSHPKALLSLQLLIMFEWRLRIIYFWITLLGIIFKAAAFSRYWSQPVAEECVMLVFFMIVSYVKTSFGEAGNKQESAHSLMYFNAFNFLMILLLIYFLKLQVVVLQFDYFTNMSMLAVTAIQAVLALLLGQAVATSYFDRLGLLVASGGCGVVTMIGVFA